MEWVHVAQDKDQWQVIVNMSSIKCGNFLIR